MPVPLPIDEVLPQVVARLREASGLVVVAPPGAGKTTRVPPAIVAAGLLAADHPALVLLQPRRVAARAVAQRIAEEQGWTLGREVGYHVRFERRLGRETAVRVITEGILTRQLLDDPLLDGVGCVVLDEFHERSLHTDLAAALLREVMRTRPELRVVVMSATLDAEPVARFLGGAPVVHSAGRMFPVQIDYRPAPVAAGTAARVRGATARDGELHIARVVADLLDAPSGDGDVLVFLPGAAEIQRTVALLAPAAARHDVEVLPLHGSLGVAAQMRAIGPGTRRRVICATNVAETSLTIPNVTTVVDSGRVRVARYDARRGMDRLALAWVSRAAATQRAGRAGRVRPGRCIRLYSEKHFHTLDAFDRPEVRRVDLSPTALLLNAWGQRDLGNFEWYEAPPPEMVAAAQRLLAMLGAVEGEEGGPLTPMGRRMAALPVHPRLARLLIAAQDGHCVELGAAIAGLLAERDILRDTGEWGRRRGAPAGAARSDLHARLAALHDAERAGFATHLSTYGIDVAAARHAALLRDQLIRIVAPGVRSGTTVEPEGDAVLQLSLLAFPDRVCRRRDADAATATMVGGGGVRLAVESAVRSAPLFVALDARADERNTRREALVRVASEIEPAWLEAHFPQSIRRERAAVYDPERGRVSGVARTWYRDLLLREDVTGSVDPAAAVAALRDALSPNAAEVIASNEAAAALLARASFLSATVPAGAWPQRDPPRVDPAEIVADACAAARCREDVVRQLTPCIEARLGHAVLRFIADHAPTHVTVPTGNRIRLDWSRAVARTTGAHGAEPTEPRGPVLEVRLQELFGLVGTPRVALGRVPVVLHLLGPNYRPVQVTTDLAGFWSRTYPQVRKDLRARYPKHSWPEDPRTAAPQAKGSPRRT